MAESVAVTDSPSKKLPLYYYFQKQNRSPAGSKIREINALDAETRDGNIFLIADSDGEFEDKITPESAISFLFRRKYENAWNFFYNLTYDAEVILKLLGTELNNYKNSRKLIFYYKEYKFTYIPDKCLRIRKKKHSVVFFDIAQFFNKKGLLKAYEQNIGAIPDSYKEMKTKRGQLSKTFYRKNTSKVRQYCIQDCKFTKELSEYFIKLFYDMFSFYPRRWVSSGYLAEKVLINNGIEFPQVKDIPQPVCDFAWDSYFGGRFEMLQRGFIGKAYIYDINSAYPYAITQLPDLNNGEWYRTDERILDKANVGFFKIKVNVDDLNLVAPFPFKKKNRILYPSGEFVTHCTLQELQVAKDDVQYSIIDSYQFIPTGKKRPFRKFINSLYQKRLELKKQNNPMQLPIKVIINSIYGKTGQISNGRIGSLFNPVIFAFITGYSRAMLYQFMKKHNLERDIVAFATDSICTRKKVNVNSDKIGEFSMDATGDDCYFLQNGFYRINKNWKKRGFGKIGVKQIEHLDTHERDGKLYFSYKEMRVGRLRKSIISNKIDDIGKFAFKEKQINLNADRKRMWIGELDGINEKSNGSVPLSFNHFTKEQI